MSSETTAMHNTHASVYVYTAYVYCLCLYMYFPHSFLCLSSSVSSRDRSEHRSHHSGGHGHSSSRPSSGSAEGSSSSQRKFSRPPGDEVYVRNYRILKTIGKGNFAKVKLARHMPTGVEVRMCMCVMLS